MYIYTSHKNNCRGNEAALSYHRLRGLYFLAVVFAATIVCCTWLDKSSTTALMNIIIVISAVVLDYVSDNLQLISNLIVDAKKQQL